jgi:hypothetical protein
MQRNTLVTLNAGDRRSAGNRTLRSWFDMERPNFPKAVSLREGRSDLLVAKHAFTGSTNFVGCSSNKEELSARARDRER